MAIPWPESVTFALGSTGSRQLTREDCDELDEDVIFELVMVTELVSLRVTVTLFSAKTPLDVANCMPNSAMSVIVALAANRPTFCPRALPARISMTLPSSSRMLLH